MEQPQVGNEKRPRSAVGGWGTLDRGHAPWGEQAQPMAIRPRKDRRGRRVGGFFPLLGLTLRDARRAR